MENVHRSCSMTSWHKIALTISLTIMLGAGLYEANQAAAARAALRQIQGDSLPQAGPIQFVQSKYRAATNELAQALAEMDRLKAGSQGVEIEKLRREKEQLTSRLLAAAQVAAAGSSNSLPATPPLAMELYKYPDTAIGFNAWTTATNVGLATPAAMIQTWLWAIRHGSQGDMRSIFDFSPGTSEELKKELIGGASRGTDNGWDYHQLIAMFPLGNDEYYVWIAESGLVSPNVMKQVLRREGGEWKMYIDPVAYHGTDN